MLDKSNIKSSNIKSFDVKSSNTNKNFKDYIYDNILYPIEDRYYLKYLNNTQQEFFEIKQQLIDEIDKQSDQNNKKLLQDYVKRYERYIEYNKGKIEYFKQKFNL